MLALQKLIDAIRADDDQGAQDLITSYTSSCCHAAIATAIRDIVDGNTGAVEAQLALLAAGGRIRPIDLTNGEGIH